ncbi:MAG: hypothetical protein V1717_03600, partial [Candidatus Micrarchaeota archaeon]
MKNAVLFSFVALFLFSGLVFGVGGAEATGENAFDDGSASTSASASITSSSQPVSTPSSGGVCSFLYGAEGGLKLYDVVGHSADEANAGDPEKGTVDDQKFESVVFDGKELVDSTYLYDLSKAPTDAVELKEIRVLSKVGEGHKWSVGTDAKYSFDPFALVEVTKLDGKKSLAAVTEIAFSDDKGLKSAYQFDLTGSVPVLKNGEDTASAKRILIKSYGKEPSLLFKFSGTKQKVSGVSFGENGPSCFLVRFDDNDQTNSLDEKASGWQWVSEIDFNGRTAAYSFGGDDVLTQLTGSKESGWIHVLSFSTTKASVSFKYCNALADAKTFKGTVAKIGKAKFKFVKVFEEKPEYKISKEDDNLLLKPKLADEKFSSIVKFAFYPLLYDTSAFESFRTPSAIPPAVSEKDLS